MTNRNDPCPCGSGRRYKDCHGELKPTLNLVATVSSEVSALLERARKTLAAGDLAGAESLWRQVLVADPDNAEANFYIANRRREAGDVQEAIAGYERALRSAPRNAGVLNNLGLALEAAGEGERALDCYEQVLAAEPEHPDALGNLANALYDRGKFEACASAYDRLFAIRSALPVPVLVRRGIALQKSRRLEEAEACFDEAARHWPDDAQVLTNLGSVRVALARYGDADAPLARAHELDAANPYTLSMLAHTRAQLCQWDGIGTLFAQLRDLLDAESAPGAWNVAPFPLAAMPLPASTLLRAARRWAQTFRSPSPALRPAPPAAPDGRLRVGFVSSDFRFHPVATLMTEVWEKIDRDRIDTFAYGILPEDTGPIGQRIRRSFEHFADVSADPVESIAERIRTDAVHILFDLNGYTQNAKPNLFALRPAPLQINSMGFPGTLGAEWYDYIHVDRFVAPPEAQPHYVERFFHMPHAYVPSDTTRAPQGPPPTRVECGLPAEAFVFCCFNNAFKLLPDIFAVWLRLLAAVPGSVLWMLDANPDARANLRHEMQRGGVASERLIFAPRVPNAQHVARNAAADLFLDTSPYGAHTTTNDALLAGLPVLTCTGETLASRNPGSQLRAIGVPELVTTSFTDYEAKALALAGNPQALAELRDRLARNRYTHPLFDMARYARDFEDGLLEIWKDYATASR
ncbi:MAG TPA: tetratricopeptide repeat protein [Casimicrobiaceae bacterium]|nr:tetratricopeptide repeat protein [Casimicrobiaceae bacterium]